MGRVPQLLDRWGNPVRRQVLTQEVAAPTLGGVRSPLSGYPGDGLNPRRLAAILRAADQGDAVSYLELAETIEERDPHYLGVLSTRKRSVSQIEITVRAASDATRDVEIADMIRDWLTRDELTEELFHILDCIGKGYSLTEIEWETSAGQYRPAHLTWRDPRHFRFDMSDLATPLMLDEGGHEVPLPAFKFIYGRIAAKSGLVLRSGLARVAAWGWMFKAFTLRDWAIFTQTYGQPLRLGRFHSGASEDEKRTLFEAVANIAGDCAAIVPEGMLIEFIEAKNVGASTDHYEHRADWFDKQISKAVLGQTTSTDAISGGHAVSREHRKVQEDIETADARALSAILNRDLIRPWVQLEYGPQLRYPQIVIARPQSEDIGPLVTALKELVPLGLKVSASEARDRLGFADPDPDEAVLGVPAPSGPAPGLPARPLNGVPAVFKGGAGLESTETAPQSEGPSAGNPEAVSSEAKIATRLEIEATPQVGAMVAQIEAMMGAATSLEEFREMLLAGFPDLDEGGLARVLAQGMIAAHAAGRLATVIESTDRG